MFSMISTLNRFYNDSILRRSLETLMWHCVLLFRKAIGIFRQKCTTRGTAGYKDIINGNSYCPKAISVSISSGLGCKARNTIGFNGNISLLRATWKKKLKNEKHENDRRLGSEYHALTVVSENSLQNCHLNVTYFPTFHDWNSFKNAIVQVYNL